KNCSFIGTHRVLAGAGTGPFKVVRFVKRRQGISSAEFRQAWREPYPRRVLDSSTALLSYAQNLADEPERPGGWGLDVDGSEEMWFDSLGAAVSYARSPSLR